MLLWSSQFQTLQPLISLPRPVTICSEEQFDTSYNWQGRYRPKTTACLFKYTLEGEGVFRYGDTEYRVTPGNGFLCRLSDPETSYYYPADAQGAWRFVWIQFEGGTVENMVSDMVNRFGSIYAMPVSQGIMERIMSFRSFDVSRREIAAPQGAELVFGLLVSLAESKSLHVQNTPASAIVRRVWELISDNPKSDYNVSTLADELNISREHLTRVFSKQAGMTPYNFIIRQKMLLACRMLKETSLSSKEIASHLGYKVPGHFTRTFRTCLKMTPIQFRDHGVMPAFETF